MTQNLPPRAGLSAPIVTSIPEKWDREWFRTFITYFLQLGKIIQNAITSGAGITVTAASSGQQQINLAQQLGESVLGVTGAATATPAAIIATADGQFLQRASGAVVFAPIPAVIARLVGRVVFPSPAGASNNVNPGGAWPNANRLITTLAAGNANWTGLQAGSDGQIVVITNADATNSLTLNVKNAGSVAANQFLYVMDFILSPGTSVVAIYDATLGFWCIT